MNSNTSLHLELPALPGELQGLRQEVRRFVAAERASGLLPYPDKVGLGFSPEASRRIAAQGWIGMTWPKRYGGHERSALDRYVVTEELLAAGVPVGAHWISDRQSGPVLLKFGTEAQKQEWLPRIVRAEVAFCIGMSEPDSGSDLASLRTSGAREEGGWCVNGTKLWTTNAHRVHCMIALIRTAKVDEKNRQAGLTQVLIPLDGPGVTVRPIKSMVGVEDFNEVNFDNVFVPDSHVVGEPGNGWNQVSAELAYERSGPERWLSTFRLLAELVQALGSHPSDAARVEVGRLFGQLMAVRQISLSIASMLERGKTPTLEASIAKDLGTRLEQEMVRAVRNVVQQESLLSRADGNALRLLLASAQRYAPAFTIRGGTGEILRGVIARGLGLR
ncbi:acyl-CoA dehydrogenase family protein [Hydrogenophaga sp.]|uniref:acyl-CoA dehydrogenase family protein n=1 Tax=Hydrogenophaga sp. TaxID=1904254 RepID=UPI002719CA44|nr:acyl-CoA dehydrogenase family protein [Hydrogenophaga sp.]MDO9435352.1 acyl-CoA dehydrogenase family protein [Hydrogenophaga sp.]